MPRKGENIYKRKDGRWEGRYIKTRNGQKTVYGYVYAKSYSEVKNKLNLKRAEYAKGEVNPSKTSQNDVNFSAVSKLWLTSMKSSVKESTWIKYRNTLNTHDFKKPSPRLCFKHLYPEKAARIEEYYSIHGVFPVDEE